MQLTKLMSRKDVLTRSKQLLVTFVKNFKNSSRAYSKSQNRNTAITEIFKSKCFDGYQCFYSHESKETSSTMKFSIYLPPAAEKTKVPVLYWLSGITANEETFPSKSGAQRYAAENGICIVGPDTSPRNLNLPKEDEYEFFGSGASFYVNATQPPWNNHYRMHSYITSELITVITENFPVIPNLQSICGYSMGALGALVCFLRNPKSYRSVSAMAGGYNATQNSLCQFAFKGFLGDNKEEWKKYDATELVTKYEGDPIEIFIDQGTKDKYYLAKELIPENLIDAASKNDRVKCIMKWRDGYDHSQYYVKSFIGDHIRYHAKILKL